MSGCIIRSLETGKLLYASTNSSAWCIYLLLAGWRTENTLASKIRAVLSSKISQCLRDAPQRLGLYATGIQAQLRLASARRFCAIPIR